MSASSILLVEDHAGFAKALLSMVAQNPGIQIVAVAESAEAALQYLRDSKVDLVLLDYSLPDMSGVNLLEALFNEHPGLLCAMLSGHLSLQHARRALELGARGTVALVGSVYGGMWLTLSRPLYYREYVGGPLFIAQAASEQARRGLDSYLQFLAMINVAIMAFNLLPLPILDGGHILLALIEAVRRQAISAKVYLRFQQAGLVIMGALLVLILANDPLRVIQRQRALCRRRPGCASDDSLLRLVADDRRPARRAFPWPARLPDHSGDRRGSLAGAAAEQGRARRARQRLRRLRGSHRDGARRGAAGAPAVGARLIPLRLGGVDIEHGVFRPRLIA